MQQYWNIPHRNAAAVEMEPQVHNFRRYKRPRSIILEGFYEREAIQAWKNGLRSCACIDYAVALRPSKVL